MIRAPLIRRNGIPGEELKARFDLVVEHAKTLLLSMLECAPALPEYNSLDDFRAAAKEHGARWTAATTLLGEYAVIAAQLSMQLRLGRERVAPRVWVPVPVCWTPKAGTSLNLIDGWLVTPTADGPPILVAHDDGYALRPSEVGELTVAVHPSLGEKPMIHEELATVKAARAAGYLVRIPGEAEPTKDIP